MNDVLLAVLCVAGALLVIRLHTALWGRVFRVCRSSDEVHYVKTRDGWTLALHRYLPARRKRFGEPILLCHGMGANSQSFDMGKERSLAADLARRGFDTWCLDLRGCGLSTKPSLFSAQSWNFDFDDYLDQDLPAALEFVRAKTASQKVFWVGHSMGGLLGLAWIGLRGDHGLAGIVALSAPVDVGAVSAISRLRALVWFMALFRVVAWRPLARFFSPFMGWPPRPVSRLTTGSDGIEGRMLRRCLVTMIENTTGRVLRQFLRWNRSGTFTSRDGVRNFLANLTKVQEPALIVTAGRDHLAPPAATTPAYQLLGSEDKQLRVFGTESGDDYDFGHGDVILGRHARAVIFPELVRWLEVRASRVAKTNP